MNIKSRTCPMEAPEFLEHATPLVGVIAGQPISLEPQAFSSGAFGYYANLKLNVLVNGKPLTLQVSVPMTVIGSKKLDSAAAVAAAVAQSKLDKAKK
jgi:hypothetical protein